MDNDQYKDTRFDGGRGNRFFSRDIDGEGPQGRFYAALEVPEVDDEELAGDHGVATRLHEPVHLECAAADWVDSMTERVPSDEFWAEVPLSVVSLDGDDLIEKVHQKGGQPGDIAWLEIHVRRAAPGEGNGSQFNHLLGPGARVHVLFEGIRGFGAPGSPMATHWIPQSHVHRFDGLPGGLGPRLSEVAGVAVFDVGQGACQALMAVEQDHLVPVLYVDVGGGVMQNLQTFPDEFRGLCRRVPIILSHWDWDHWSSVSRFPSLLESDWIAPLPPEKPIQQALAWILLGLGRLSMWLPGQSDTYRAKNLLLERCTGKTTNDSGIAVTLLGGSRKSKRCLLPGDAGYRHIPSVLAGARFNALSVTHHGGRMHSKVVPTPRRGAIAACSVGAGNSYKHPFWETVEAHREEGWPTPIPTGHFGHRPSHVFLPWEGKPTVVAGSCGFSPECSVAFTVEAVRGVNINLRRRQRR
jgi:beta-lactamase superfamily II metal-dependent hydrolase